MSALSKKWCSYSVHCEAGQSKASLLPIPVSMKWNQSLPCMNCSLPSPSLFKLSHNRRRQKGLPATTVATTARKEVALATWATPFVSFLSAALCLHLRELPCDT